MRKSKSLITNTKDLFANIGRSVADYYRKNRSLLGQITNLMAILAFTIGVVALFSLIWMYVRPMKVADIKVPVATDQATYHPGEQISGIFFGEIFHKGEVRVLREIFCREYKAIIAPPPVAENGDFYDTQSIPRKIEGLTVTIGLLPDDVPIGSNCVLQFTNVYRIQTPFGIRHIDYQYYTQNFSIVTRERRLQLECEADGNSNCNYIFDDPERELPPLPTPRPQESVDSAPDTTAPQNVYYDNRSTTITPPPTPEPTEPLPPAEPAPRFIERCTVDLLGIKINCRQQQVN